MFRNYILHRKPRCSVSKLINRVFMKCGQTTNFTILLIFCKQTEKSHTAIALLQKIKDMCILTNTYQCCGFQQLVRFVPKPNNTPTAWNSHNPSQFQKLTAKCKHQLILDASILFQNRTPQIQASKTTSSSLTHKLSFEISRYPLQSLRLKSHFKALKSFR